MRMASEQESAPLPKQMVFKTIEVPTVGIEVMEIKPRASAWAADIIRYLDASKMPDNR